ncbi:MAG: HAMP domain-containing protein, partial [Planctomycetes bacterium]|nr:HAMP domain-containing protein [Planctomycetota bacterium]
MRERVRGGLQRRFVIHFVGLLIVAAGTIEAALVCQNYRDVLAAERHHTVGHARSVAMFAEAGLRNRDPSHLPLTLQALAADARLRGIEVFDANGILFAQYHRSGASNADRVLPLPDAARRDVSKHAEWVECAAGAIFATVPIWSASEPFAAVGNSDPAPRPGALLGYARVTRSLEQLHAQVVDRILAAIVLFAVIVLVFSSATLVFVRNLTRPLRDLLNTTTAIADGRRGERIPETGPGEIGVLAHSFNHMADRLAQSHASTERVIEQRTRELVRANDAKSRFLANM